ncbi:MAG: zinc-dependent alcohol dehydrogenase [Microthrixaceae bacterium]
MRALVFRGPMELGWEEVPAPEIVDPRDALVRPIAVARCDLDPAIALGLYPMPAPFVMGHEMVGEVVAVGDAPGVPAVGDRVIVPFQLSCGDCAACRRGHTNACELVAPGTAFGLGPHGGVDLGGALAELVRVPWSDVMCLPLPAGLDPVVAAGIPDNVADGFRCVAEPLAAHPGAPVLVVGGLAASVGLHAVMAAVALGAAEVAYVDDDPERLALAERLGARPVDATGRWDDPELGGRFPITVDANVLDHGRDLALRATAPCGTCTSVSGGASARSELPLQQMYLKGVRYEIGRVHALATAGPVLDLVTAGRLDPGAVITRTVPFSNAAEAMLEPATKIVFTNDLS